MDQDITLGYWGIRGLGQIPRLLLTYTNANWKEKTYTDRESWFNNDKKSMSLAFPNLPYLLDGNTKITESNAINRYIINRSEHRELLGKDPRDQALVDNVIGVFIDLRTAYSSLFFSENFADEIKTVPQKLQKKLQSLQKFYGDKQFALGYLTLADFMIAEGSYYIKEVSEALYNKYPFLENVRKGVESLAEVQAYYEKEGAIKEPFMPPTSNIKPKLN